MPLIFDYQGLLRLNDETYAAWEPVLEPFEEGAIDTATQLNPDINVAPTNISLRRYCRERILIEMYGGEMSASIFSYHKAQLADLEERFRYGGGVS